MIFVFDASAILRFVLDETGGERVQALLMLAEADKAEALISAVNWGEVVMILHRRLGADLALEHERKLRLGALRVIDATAERASRSALLRNRLKIPYADCFGIELASDSPRPHPDHRGFRLQARRAPHRHRVPSQ